MPYCMNCGREIPENAKFCTNCGSPQNNFDINEGVCRKTIYEGEIHKCPNCGEVLSAFAMNCPTCGYEIRGAKANSSVQEFALRLSQNITDTQMIQLVRNFPIPNTKEDILEFMLLASSNFNAENSMNDSGVIKEISDAWFSKLEQCYQKAKLLFDNESDFVRIENIYDDVNESISIAKKKKILRAIFSIAIRNISVCIGIVVMIIAVMIDQGGENSSMVELISYAVLIISAIMLPARNAEIVDFGVGAISGVLIIMLSFLLGNGSMGELCGGTILVIIAIGFFKNMTRKRK